MSEASVEDAIHAWVVNTSGFAADKVIWEGQDSTRPTVDFITLKLGADVPMGSCDVLTESTDLTAPAGQEITTTVIGWRRLPCTVQVFARALTGDSTARAVLARVRTGLSLPGVSGALNAAGLGVVDRGSVQYVPALFAPSRFESRAVLSVSFSRTETASEKTGYIDEVEAEGTIQGTVDGDDWTVTVDLP